MAASEPLSISRSSYFFNHLFARSLVSMLPPSLFGLIAHPLAVFFIHSFIHSFILLFNCSVFRLFSHFLVLPIHVLFSRYSFLLLLICSCGHSLLRSSCKYFLFSFAFVSSISCLVFLFIRLFVYSMVYFHLLILCPVCLLVYLFIFCLMCSFTNSFPAWLVRSLVHPFIYSFITAIVILILLHHIRTEL